MSLLNSENGTYAHCMNEDMGGGEPCCQDSIFSPAETAEVLRSEESARLADYAKKADSAESAEHFGWFLENEKAAEASAEMAYHNASVTPDWQDWEAHQGDLS